MNGRRAERLLVGRDERLAERFLLLAVGVSASSFAVLLLGRSLRHLLPPNFAVGAVVVYLLGTFLGAGVYAARNSGVLVTLVGTFLTLSGYAVFFSLHYLLCLSTCPTLVYKISVGVLTAAGAAVPVGGTAFVVGAGGRRLQNGQR